jgi:hypothetical protein
MASTHALQSTRLVTGDPWRKTRLHDMRANFVGARALATDLPRVVVEAAMRRTVGRYPPRPWIPYPVIRTLASNRIISLQRRTQIPACC